MKLYFNHNYVKVAADGKSKSVWALYQGFDGVNHIFKMSDGKPMSIAQQHPSATVEWKIPTGWFNTKKSSVFSERMPKRQYYKGISAGHNVQFTTAECMAKECVKVKDEKALGLLSSLSSSKSFILNPTTVGEIFEGGGYYGFEAAYMEMKAKKVFARALSEDFAMLPHPTSKDFLIFCHDVPVAEVVTKSKIKTLIPNFKPECSQFFQKEGIAVV